MAKVFLKPGDSFTLASGSSTVFGASGTETVVIEAGVAGLAMDQNVERVQFPAWSSDYLYWQTGNQLHVYDGSGTTRIASLTVQGDGTQLVFPNGMAEAKFSAAGALFLGGGEVSSTAPSKLLDNVYLPVIVADPSTMPAFSVAPASSSAAEGGYASFVVTLSPPQAAATSIDYTLIGRNGAVLGIDAGTPLVSGAGISASGSTLTFAPGSGTATLSVPIIFDSEEEIGEVLNVSLANPSPGIGVSLNLPTSASIALTEAPTPVFSLTSGTLNAPVQEGGALVFTVTPSSVVTVDTVLMLTLAGAMVGSAANPASAADFFPSTASIPFQRGDTAAKAITVSAVIDGVAEGSEGFQASLLDSSATKLASLAGVVTDVANGIYLQRDTAVEKEGGSVVYTVTSLLAAPTGGIAIPYTLTGGATAALDYSGSAADGTLLIPAGATSVSLALRALADDTTEGDESVVMTLGMPQSGTLIAGWDVATAAISDTSTTPQTSAFLQTGETFVLSNAAVSVFGASGMETAVLAAKAEGIVIDQNVENVQFSLASSVCRFQQAGDQLVVLDSTASTRLATITLQTDSDGTRLVFSNGSAEARWDHGVMTLAGTPVDATPAVIDLSASAFDIGVVGSMAGP